MSNLESNPSHSCLFLGCSVSRLLPSTGYPVTAFFPTVIIALGNEAIPLPCDRFHKNSDTLQERCLALSPSKSSSISLHQADPLSMAPLSKKRKNRLDFDNPDGFSIEVRKHVIELIDLQKLIERYTTIFGDLQSFAALNRKIENLMGILDEIKSEIASYVSDSSEINFKDFEFGIANMTAENLENELDDFPCDYRARGKTSASEEKFREDVEVVIERIWDEIREQGYKLHTAMINA